MQCEILRWICKSNHRKLEILQKSSILGVKLDQPKNLWDKEKNTFTSRKIFFIYIYLGYSPVFFFFSYAFKLLWAKAFNLSYFFLVSEFTFKHKQNMYTSHIFLFFTAHLALGLKTLVMSCTVLSMMVLSFLEEVL